MATDFSVVKELIREKLDPVVLLEYYGVDLPDRNFRYNRIRGCCPIHGGDNDTAFSFDLNTKTFTCFTNHCGETPDSWWFVPREGHLVPRDMFLFIKLMEESRAENEGKRGFKCSFTRAVQIASHLSGIPLDDSTSGYNKEMMDKLDNQKWMRSMNKINQEVEMEPISEEELEYFVAQLPLTDYLQTREGLPVDEDVLEVFQVGYSMDGVDEPYKSRIKDFDGRVIFPVRDVDGVLVGWSGRLCTDDEDKMKRHRKWRHKMDFDKGFTLYNYHLAKDFIKQSGEIILCEGPWDVMRLWSYGIQNAVAVMGSSLTPEQMSLAISHAHKVYVWLDGDGAGKSGARRIAEQLRRYCDVFMVETEEDPDDLLYGEAWEAIANAKRYVSDEVSQKVILRGRR